MRILDGYLSGIEAGRPADPDKLLADHPALAGQLRAYLLCSTEVAVREEVSVPSQALSPQSGAWRNVLAEESAKSRTIHPPFG